MLNTAGLATGASCRQPEELLRLRELGRCYPGELVLAGSVSLSECVQQITEDVIHASVTAGSLCPLPALRTSEHLADHYVIS